MVFSTNLTFQSLFIPLFLRGKIDIPNKKFIAALSCKVVKLISKFSPEIIVASIVIRRNID
jgi:hypothetical protein